MKRKLLVIKPVLPYPPNQGTKLVTLRLVEILRERFHLTLCVRLQSRQEELLARELAPRCDRLVTVMAPNRRSPFHRAGYKMVYGTRYLLGRRSLKSQYDCPGAMMKAVRSLASEDFDLVLIEYWQLAPLASLFPPSRTVLLTHDIDMLVNRQVSLLERNLARKLASVRKWLVEQREEIRAYRSIPRILTLTKRDKLAVERLKGGEGEVSVLPFGIDVARYSPPGMERNGGEILFLGALEAGFNRDAIGYFARRIYPLLEDIEGLSLTVVGGPLPKELDNFALAGEVEVVGKVEDVRPYLHRASCMVVPLRFGGGLRIRILEALAAGLPVVATKAAVAGMELREGQDYLGAETPEEFSAQLESILDDRELWLRISQSGLRRVEELYSRRVQDRKVVELFLSFLDNANDG